MRRFLERYFRLWWLPPLIYLGLLVSFSVAGLSSSRSLSRVADGLLCIACLAFVGVIAVALRHSIHKQWSKALVGLLLIGACGLATIFAAGFLAFASMFGPSEDGFADDLKMPVGIEIAEPEQDESEAGNASAHGGSDALQDEVRKALTVPGGNKPDFVAHLPSLRKAASEHASAFKDYIEASPDWHVFLERGNRFASRRWTYGGEPRDTLHGYISEFQNDSRFQTRCLVCLDRKQWSTYAVQKVTEGNGRVVPEVTDGNNLHESRVMIDCGEVWVEIFEQSGQLERRITKATVSALEREFAEFLVDPQGAVASVRNQSRDLAKRLAGAGAHSIRLLSGMQPGIYVVALALNPGEAGTVYLKAFEVTKATPLSVDRLEEESKTRMAWSKDPSEHFAAKVGFTIYEGDWGKPYAARFEAWFRPDSGGSERKLAERVFKIEGWQR